MNIIYSYIICRYNRNIISLTFNKAIGTETFIKTKRSETLQNYFQENIMQSLPFYKF